MRQEAVLQAPAIPLPSPPPSRPPRLRVAPRPVAADPVLQGRDPARMRQLFPLLAAVSDLYFRAEVEGAEHLSSRASIVTATHNGGMATPDVYCLMVAFWTRHGLETPAYGLMHHAAFHLPYYGPLLTACGAIPASVENGQRVLRADHPLMVCPGGDVDSLKPYRDRHRICFEQRRGFIRLAIREQVPLVPVVSTGAHETLFVLNDGRRLARLLGYPFRIKSMPLALAFPFGLTIAGIPSLPLPAKIRIRVLPPIELCEPRSAADDPQVVERCFEHVRRRMQAALDDLAARHRWPVLG